MYFRADNRTIEIRSNESFWASNRSINIKAIQIAIKIALAR